jgi:hypothetical protein
MLAITLRVPELELEPEEAKRLETAIKRVSRHYPVNVNQKQVDVAMLIYALGTVYGTRAVAIYTARKAAAPEAQSGNDPNVVNFSPNFGIGA